MQRAIKVLTMGEVWPGMHITSPDDETPVDAMVDPANYDPDEQDWQHVRARTGHVDLPTFTLAYYSGEEYTVKYQSGASVWVLVDEQGQPVTQEVER